MAKKYTKSFSNYIKKSNPIATNSGTILENDLLTYGEPYNYVNKNLTIRTEGGFTFITNTDTTDKKEYTNGEFTGKYTLNDLLSIPDTGKTPLDKNILNVKLTPEKTYINFKKSYFDLSKFCYYGSTNDLIRSSVEDIINRFPGGLFISDSSIISGNNTKIITIPISNISNPFNLNLLSYEYDRNLSYDLKTLATSYSDYIILTEDNQTASITGFTSSGSNIIIDLDKVISLSTSFHIKPSLKKQDEFFDSLDDFQSTLLNRKTQPKYKSTFKIPEETEDGISSNYRDFIWRTYDGYNIDITSVDYELFIQELIDSSILVDEKYSDNIYRMMTHDSIKNMDSTYQKVIDNELLEEYVAGGTKIQSLLRIYGRFYDEVKKYAEGIAFTNNISYDKKDNIPEKYLQGKVNSLGWESPSLLNIFPETGVTSNKIFRGCDGNFNLLECTNELNRRIILSSKSISSSKGTRASIRKIFGMFGIDESIYDVREYTQKVDNYITGTTLQNIITLNEKLRLNEIENLYGSQQIISDDILLTGVNVGTFVMSPKGSMNYTHTGDTATDLDFDEHFSIIEHTYGYPKARVNSNEFYFQQMGGWYRETGGQHTDLTGNTYVTNITSGNNPHTGNGSYDYGFNYIDQFTNLFKTDIDKQGNYPSIDLTEYTNSIGFNINSIKTVDNNKIKWIGDQNYIGGKNILTDDFYRNILTDTGDLIYIDSNNNISDSKLTLNLKNFVIGINAKKAKELFYAGNMIGKTGISEEEIFISIKNLILPYLEHVIPSSAIFDFVLINTDTPKWVLVDKYCGRTNDINQNFNGQTILRYKNMNYFDETSTGFTSDLTNLIKKDFGDMFVQIPAHPKDTIVGFEREILFTGDNGSCQRDESPKWIEKTDLFNF